MKALVLHAANTPFSLEDVPDPVAGPGEAVARVITCGSGLTIQHIKAGRNLTQFPRIIGHEITGEIVEVGAGVGCYSGSALAFRISLVKTGHRDTCWGKTDAPILAGKCDPQGREIRLKRRCRPKERGRPCARP